MKRYIVIREKDVVEVLILKNKNDGTYTFANLTKGHICPCRFKSIQDAIDDMEHLKSIGKIKEYIELPY